MDRQERSVCNDGLGRSADPGGRRRLGRRAWLGVLAGGLAVSGLGACGGSRIPVSGPASPAQGVQPGPAQCAPPTPEPDEPASATADVEQWRAGGHEAWRTDTGTRMEEAVFPEDFFFSSRFTQAYDPLDHEWCFTDEPWPQVVFEGQDLTVFNCGMVFTGLGTRDGAARWSTTLTPPSTGFVWGGVAAGRAWTTAGVIELTTGEVTDLPGGLAGASDLSVGVDKDIVYGLVPPSGRAGIKEDLVAVSPDACGEIWRISGAGDMSYFDATYDTFVVDDELIDLKSGERVGPASPSKRTIVDPWMPGETYGLYTGAYFPDEEGATGPNLVVLVDDDGTAVTVRAVEGMPWEFTYPVSEDTADTMRAAPAVWEVPTELRPGAVYSWPARVTWEDEGKAAAFWILDLDADARIYLSRWEPGPA